jgi:hypothetical protein
MRRRGGSPGFGISERLLEGVLSRVLLPVRDSVGVVVMTTMSQGLTLVHF